MSLIAELKRRNVFKVSAAYIALGWIVMQVTSAVVPALNLPPAINSMVVWMGVAAFPFVVIFSWVFELTPEGLKRESEIARDESITHVTGRKLDYLIVGLLVAAIAIFVLDRFFPRDVGAGHARDSSAEGALPVEDSRGHGPLPQEANSAPAPDAKSIAVLPFADMSQAKDQEYFSDGIAEELLNLLTKVPSLHVAARTSSFAFKGQNLEIQEIAKRLNVANVLEGSLRKSGNKVRITAQLVRASDGYHLWSETYDRSLDDIFAVQDEIAAAVVVQLKIALLGAAPKAQETDPKAYALYLQGRQLSRQFTAAGYTQGLALLEQSLAIDPAYAPALDDMARTFINQALDGLEPADASIQRARAAVDRALASDPDFAPAHGRLGFIAMSYDHDLATAARHMSRAVELDPTSISILVSSATLAQNLGRLEQAIAIGEHVVAKDPVNTVAHANLGIAYYAAGRLDEAMANTRTALSLSPGYIGAPSLIGTVLLLKGDNDAALGAMQQEPGEAQRLAGLAIAQPVLGHRAEGDAALAELIARFGKLQAYGIAGTLAFRGEADRAFEWLDKAVQLHDPAVVSLVVDPNFRNLREDPRWLALLRKLGMAPEQLAAIPFDVKLPE